MKAVVVQGLTIWEVIAAKIAQLSRKQSRREYIGILREYCDFIGATPGTPEGAERFLRVTDIDVIQFQNYIKNKQGVLPRELMKAKAVQKVVVLNEHGQEENECTAAPATILRKLVLIRSFYKLLNERGLINHNPFSIVRLPRQGDESKCKSKPIPLDKVREIFQTFKLSERGIQDRAIFAVLLAAGLRRSEVAGLRLMDVQITDSKVTFLKLRKTKSQVMQRQAMPAWAVDMLAAWIAIREKRGATPQDSVFVGAINNGNHSGSINGQTISRRLKRWVAAVGLNPNLYSAHSTRHTAVTKLYLDKHHLVDIMNFARHKSVSTTLKYIESRKQIDESIALKISY